MNNTDWLGYALLALSLSAGSAGVGQTLSEIPPAELAEHIAAAEAAAERGGAGPYPAVMLTEPALPTHTNIPARRSGIRSK